MKKILVIGLISGLCSTGAFAACAGGGGAMTGGAATGGTADTDVCICNGGAAVKSNVNGGAGTANSAPVFIKTGFDVQCSANTFVNYNEVSATLFAVASGSQKGNQAFAGTSNGGAIGTSTTACDGTNKACTATNVSAALTAAVSAASSQ